MYFNSVYLSVLNAIYYSICVIKMFLHYLYFAQRSTISGDRNKVKYEQIPHILSRSEAIDNGIT